MRYGLSIATLGDYASPRLVVQFAQAAEAAGWEALFVWDHLAFAWGVPSGDPWVTLAAVAQATTRLKIGTAITPVPRRRPHVLAHAVATLDVLSGGRVIFGAGLGGVPEEFRAFGEPDDAGERAAKLDEGLEVLSALWSGQAVTHHGTHYTVENVTLAPRPVQRPRIPIWIGGESRAALRRAARWDGWIAGGDNEAGEMITSPPQAAEEIAYLGQHRPGEGAIEIALTGVSSVGDRQRPREYAAVGVTWWLESIHGLRGSFEQLLARIAAGPPA